MRGLPRNADLFMMQRNVRILRRRVVRTVRAGFTLIELLAVILIITLLATFLLPMVNDAFSAGENVACQTNLSNIHKGIILYKTKYRKLPNESGVRFFAQLYSREAIEQSKTNAERLTCPAVDKGALTIGDMPWEEWWTDLEAIEGNYSSYAGRDSKEYPLRKLKADEPLVCDDNDPLMNHGTTTNVLYGDGSVQQFENVLLREEGVMAEEEEVLIVGPDSPVEDLQKMSLD
jgi:prepilin-type N-terminal cleavage/methylation domain-containing protein/prepilin-type processing-associated H-X9-DG protein